MVLEASELGSASGEDVLAAMRTVELLHVATLLHDDVIDGSEMRRGEPSVSHRYGALAAQYSGGWMLGAALQLVSGLGQDAADLFAEVVGELCAGQMLETQHLWDTCRSQADYERAVTGKTASLFRLSAQLGGLVAGVEEMPLSALGQFGRSFGIAFQLADDLGDLLADPVNTGKDHGADVRHGVYTLPVLYALETDPGLLGDKVVDTGELDLDYVVERVLRTDAVTRVLSLCEAHLTDATAAVQDLQVPGLLRLVDESRQSLGALV
jgi:geranylgeranyl pyrophosphate synthase